jgi:acyl-coenzyme A synthetase/AMP-(fatty) acid ligase
MAGGEQRSQDPTATNGTPESNLSTAIIAALRAGGPRSRPVVIDDAGSWTVDQLHGAVSRAAGALRACGVARGDRVVVALTPGRAWLQAFLGAVHLGAIAVPVDPNDHGSGLALLLDDLDPSLVVAEDDRRWPAARIGLADLDRRAPIPAVAVAPGDCAFVIATSGTTGRAKGVMHAHGPSSAPGYVCNVLGVGGRDRVLSASAGFSALGLFIGILRPLASGACVVLSGRRPTVRAIVTTLRGADVTVLSAVPTFWAQLAAFLERHPAHAGVVARLARAVSSGEPLPPSVALRIRDVVGVELLDGYGSAECGDIVIGHRQGGGTEGLGRPAPGVDVRLERLAGPPGASGSSGRLLVRCATATLGYWGRPDESAQLLGSGWLRSGDVVRHCRGGLRHEGRVDGGVKVNGHWLQPGDAEACLYEHPSVVEAAVVAVRSRRDVASAAVFVAVGESRPEGLVGDLRRLLAERVGTGAARARVTVLDQLPRLSSGKLDRRALVESFA